MDFKQQKKLSKRIFLLAFAIACLILANGIFSVWQMNNVKKEFHQVAYKDLPLTAQLVPLIDMQLEQVILLERLAALEAEHHQLILPFLYGQFSHKSSELTQEFAKLFALIERVEVGAKRSTATEIESLRRTISSVKTEHDQFQQQANLLFEQPANGITANVDLLIISGKGVSDKLVNARNQLQQFTLQSAKNVERHESLIMQAVVLFTLFVYLLGILMLMVIWRIIIVRDKLVNQVVFHATYDTLTEIYNRRYFFKSLHHSVKYAKRYQHPLSLCMCDLDYFKQVNDQKGHQAGDQVLIDFSNIIKEELRDTDFAGRFGGDEFVICFPNTSSVDAVNVLERIRVRLERFEFRDHKQNTFHVTATFGVVDLQTSFETDDLLLEAADKALYNAKENGRNQIASS